MEGADRPDLSLGRAVRLRAAADGAGGRAVPHHADRLPPGGAGRGCRPGGGAGSACRAARGCPGRADRLQLHRRQPAGRPGVDQPPHHRGDRPARHHHHRGGTGGRRGGRAAAGGAADALPARSRAGRDGISAPARHRRGRFGRPALRGPGDAGADPAGALAGAGGGLGRHGLRRAADRAAPASRSPRCWARSRKRSAGR